MAKAIAYKIVVSNVRVNAERTQSVRFKFNIARDTYIARTRGLPSIQIKPKGNGWVASSRGMKDAFDARNPDRAFGAAAKVFWAQ